ncbi:MAG: patatin-like phospholipase family protein [Cyanobacteriota bacterium]|nr:patatin-like phospholipase family protein [Cyanobacteriota bacterium]
MGKKLGLALGSGGARGWAHIGVIRALQAARIPIDYLAGASIGAFVGGIYAAGQLDELEGFVRELDWKMLLSYFDVTFPNRGLLDGNRVYELLAEHLGELAIETTLIPFCCVATDLLTGEQRCLKSGPMVEAIRASIAIPGIFTPLEKDNTFLADGGIVNPVPVDVVREMGADVVVAVNLSRYYSPESSGQTLQVATESSLLESADKEEYLATVPEGGLYPQLINTLKTKYSTLKESLQQKLDGWATPEKSGPNIFDVIGSAINIMEQKVTQRNLEICPADLLIEPDLTTFGIFDFHRAEEVIRTGYRQTRRAIPHIRSLLAS